MRHLRDKPSAPAGVPPSSSASVYTTSTATAATSAWPGLTSDGRDAYSAQARVSTRRPRSVARLIEDAQFVFDPKPRLQAYLRGLENLRRQAAVYEHEGDLETAFVLYTRCARLGLENIPKHPEFERVRKHDIVKRILVSNSQEALESMRRLKPILKERYELAMQQQIESIDKSASALELETLLERPHGLSDDATQAEPPQCREDEAPERVRKRDRFLRRVKGEKATTPALSSSTKLSKVDDDFSLIAANAIRPVSSRHSSIAGDWVTGTASSSSSRPASTHRSSYAGSSLQAHPASTIRDDPRADQGRHTHWSPTMAHSTYANEAARLLPPMGQPLHLSAVSANQLYQPPSTPFGIPYAPTGQYTHYVQPKSDAARPTNLQLAHQMTKQMDTLNYAKPDYSDSLSLLSAASSSRVGSRQSTHAPLPSPMRPSKTPLVNNHDRWSLPPAMSPQPEKHASAYRDAHVHAETTPPSMSQTEGGVPLRPIMLPADFIETFAAIALPNTERNIETCGLILGKLSRNAFTVSALMIPKQWGTSDMCTAEQEEDILDVCDRKDAIVLGWIHTHPQHPCFLSSMDLHTHCSYQTMLPEAIAIVVAPLADRKVGIFRLTDPPGTAVIGQCGDPRPFHPHMDMPIYTDVDIHHVVLQPQLPLDVVDVR